MNNTLTYNSVSKYQIDAVLEKFGLTEKVDGVQGETTLSGESPLGEFIMQVAFVPLSGQLTVVVIKKPTLVALSTIDGHIRAALAEAAAAADTTEDQGDKTTAAPPKKPAATSVAAPATPITPTAPVVPPASPSTKQ